MGIRGGGEGSLACSAIPRQLPPDFCHGLIGSDTQFRKGCFVSSGQGPGVPVTTLAHANIALVKYWGKRDLRLNLPAVGSISLTLNGLSTRTTVEFGDHLEKDCLLLDGSEVNGNAAERVSQFLDLVRERAGIQAKAEVVSENDFPTGAGLASSASGFAALSLASTRAAGLELDPKELSILARRGSGSAARSIFGGLVEMHRGDKDDGSDAFAMTLAGSEEWPLRLVVAMTSLAPKTVGSTMGMQRSSETSPYYQSWVESSAEDLEVARRAIEDRDLVTLGEVTEHSCLKMHSLTWSSRPPFSYWSPETLRAMEVVRRLRGEGLVCYFTMDAGPQVKALCDADSAGAVAATLSALPGVERVLTCSPGEGVRIESPAT